MGSTGIDLSAGMVPRQQPQQQGVVNLSAGLIPKGSASDTPDSTTPQKGFLDRVNDRIAGNIRSIASPLQYIHDFTEEVKRRSALPYVPGQGLKEIGQTLQKTYSDPANLVADVATAGILHSIGGGGEEAAPERTAAEAPVETPQATTPKVSPKLADLLQNKIQNAAARFVMKRIPGAHMAMDLKDLYEAIKPEQGPPTIPTPAGPTGPPEQWGQTIPAASAEPYPNQGASTQAGLARANANQSLVPEQESALGRLRNLLVPERGVDPEIRPSIERIVDEPSSSPQSAKARLESLLNEGLGGKPLEQGVALKNQGVKLPQGFTPLESSALKGYRYNSESSEFEAMSQNGQHYIYGDVSPEQAESFANSNSKGQAWNNLRQSSPLVAKVINGKRVPVRAAQSAAP